MGKVMEREGHSCPQTHPPHVYSHKQKKKDLPLSKGMGEGLGTAKKGEGEQE